MLITEALREGMVLFDGGMGTMLQSRGLAPGELPEVWNILRPEDVTDIHREYIRAGSRVVTANTFGANGRKFDGTDGRYTVKDIVTAGVFCARRAAEESAEKIFTALDIGSLGLLVGRPDGIGFEDAVSLFSEAVRAGCEAGADFVLIETMSDLLELKAALLAAKEVCSLPVVATVVFDSSGHMMSGASPAAVVAMLEGMGAAALGMNCSLGPEQMINILPEMIKYSSVPLVVQPNAGLPRVENGRTVYDVSPARFAALMAEMAAYGVRGLGGCCGTTPEYIRELRSALDGITPPPLTDKGLTLVSSATRTYIVGEKPLLIGERINPTGKARIKEALRAGDYDSVIAEGLAQEELGAHMLDVNAGLPGIDEAAALTALVSGLQRVTQLPLQIDTADPAAMERALRGYCGIPLINSVSAKRESLDAILPVVKKYGGVVIGLTLDENGIPSDAAGRLALADRIYDEAAQYGIPAKQIVIDPLTLSVSTDTDAAAVTLAAVAGLSAAGRHTLLGVSNVSFGLPARDTLNAAFFTMALRAGLSLAIMNPRSSAMRRAYHASLALTGHDAGFEGYIDFSSSDTVPETSAAPAPARRLTSDAGSLSPLHSAIVRGLATAAAAAADELLAVIDGTEVINRHIIPALDEVGAGFEKQTLFLPQLLSSADAATAAFSRVRASMKVTNSVSKGRIILATVKGDIHDIGKNIVRMLLENYGYDVIDLGRDVSYETILLSTEQNKVRLVGLSALMTTTLPAMEQTIKALHSRFTDCRVMVGGAVLTPEYAAQIGADFYAPDAAAAVRIAADVFGADA